jgi:hypothetical protein
MTVLRTDKRNTRRRAHYVAHRARILAYNRAYRRRNRKLFSRWRRVRVYGTDGAALWVKQDGRCAICRRKLLLRSKHARAAHLDHKHGTKQVRGWLCSRCNTALGLLGDKPARLIKAVQYLGRADG